MLRRFDLNRTRVLTRSRIACLPAGERIALAPDRGKVDVSGGTVAHDVTVSRQHFAAAPAPERFATASASAALSARTRDEIGPSAPSFILCLSASRKALARSAALA